MTFDDKTAAWIKNGGEVDLPRDPDDWHKLAYRSIVWNSAAKVWQYITRAHTTHGGQKSNYDRIIYSYRYLADLINVTNRIHQIDDECLTLQ
tara:strand:- start:454 stop:729 length:276 start_codon:yes stop_codon:yes gene_type:complete